MDLSALPSRILNKISFEPMTGCWLWTASCNHDGYGMCWTGETHTSAHRFVFARLKKKIPKELELDHLCRVRCCVNPDHMELVPHKTNVFRGISMMAEFAKQTHCKHGHPLSGDNLRLQAKRNRDGYEFVQRVCVTCNKLSSAAWKKSHPRIIH